MSLTKTDLVQIKTVVNETVTEVVNPLISQAMAGLATKTNLTSLATKDELKDLATKADVKNLATKADLDRMESRLVTAINLLERDSFTRLDDHEARLRRLEQTRP